MLLGLVVPCRQSGDHEGTSRVRDRDHEERRDRGAPRIHRHCWHSWTPDLVRVAGPHLEIRLRLRLCLRVLHVRVRVPAHPGAEHRCGVALVRTGEPPIVADGAGSERQPKG